MSQAEGTVCVKLHRPFVLVASKPWPMHLLLLIKFDRNTATFTHSCIVFGSFHDTKAS